MVNKYAFLLPILPMDPLKIAKVSIMKYVGRIEKRGVAGDFAIEFEVQIPPPAPKTSTLPYFDKISQS